MSTVVTNAGTAYMNGPESASKEVRKKMTAALWQDVSTLTERESVFWYLAAMMRSLTRNLLGLVLWPFLAVAVLVVAQVVPSRLLAMVTKLNKALPDVSDKNALLLIRDVLALYAGAAKFFAPVCLLRGSMAEAREELCETIDSIELVLENQSALQEFVERSEALRSPALPLFFDQSSAA